MSNQLKAITLTHVRYFKGDQLGCFLAWISLVPVFISLGGFVSHFLFRRELQVAQVFAGAGLGIFLGGLWFWVVNSILRGIELVNWVMWKEGGLLFGV
ncbi:unnamed protein product [Lactuca virosa]|uniref:Uncharacterized protein n=1 Tax=Lactuca virosa TaxID=75947 RepID=A0AAU9PQ38_9ASTR|nr:unnamed protein product [Lactuca virosa]